MQTFFLDYINRLQECHNDILKALERLPTTALDWCPGPDTNSISVLVTHLTGAERDWIGNVAAQDPKERDRDAEFRVHDLDVETLKRRLIDTLEYARNAVDKFTLEDLESTRLARKGQTFTVGWALLHALEHATLHLGQIQLTRQLWDQANVSD